MALKFPILMAFCVLCFSVFGGCARPPLTDAELGPYPADYKTIVLRYVAANRIEFEHFGGWEVSEPVKARTRERTLFLPKHHSGWFVCVSYIAERVLLPGRVRIYRAFLINRNTVVHYIESGRRMWAECRAMKRQPWPEFEAELKALTGG